MLAQQNNIQGLKYSNVFNNRVQVQTRGNQPAPLYATNNIVQRNNVQTSNRRVNTPKQSERLVVQHVKSVKQIKNVNSNPINRVNIVKEVNTEQQQQSLGNMNENISDNNIGNINQVNDVNYIVNQENEAPVQSQIASRTNVSDRNFSLDFNVPKINFNTAKYSGSSSSKTSTHKSFQFKKKLSKMNRKMHSKFAFTKKLKMKVDLCCNWG